MLIPQSAPSIQQRIAALLAAKQPNSPDIWNSLKHTASTAAYAFEHPIARLQNKGPFAPTEHVMFEGKPVPVNAGTIPFFGAGASKIKDAISGYFDTGPKNVQDLLEIQKPRPNMQDSFGRNPHLPAGNSEIPDSRLMRTHMAMLMIRKMGRNK